MEEQYVSEAIITSMVQSQIIGRLQEEEQPVEHDIPDGYRALRMPIFLAGRYGRFIGVYDYFKPLDELEGECLRLIAKAVTAALTGIGICLDRLSDSMLQNTLESIRVYCEQYRLQAGASFEFTQTEHTPCAYRRAVYALSKPDAKNKVSLFESHMIDYIMERCLDGNTAQFFKHPAIQKIQDYDAKYMTHYYETLKVYLNNFCSLKGTAAALGIHYNTMKYRIKALEKIVGQSLRDNEKFCKTLLCSAQFIEYGNT